MNPWKCGFINGVDSRHDCGMMVFGQGCYPRCNVYKDAIDRIDRHNLQLHTNPWWKLLLDDCNGIATFPPQSPSRHPLKPSGPAEREKASSYARPGHCILDGKLISGTQVRDYIAVSYVWDPNPVWKDWCGRRVTEQSLKLSERLSKYTTLPLWIDAACIPQNDQTVKMKELAKMADIYKGARIVLCLVPEVSVDACFTLARCNAIMNDECYSELQNAIDIYGSFMFATHGEHSSLRDLFASRWWERAWTFQEAVLNPHTYLVGDEEESIPIQRVLRIADPVRRRAASAGLNPTLGRPASFWDSVTKMVDASMGVLTVGDTLSCVWRRNATVSHDMVYSLLGVCGLSKQVRPDYDLPVNAVLIQLFESASSRGDYSWLIWCQEIHHDEAEDGMSMVPTPEQVRVVPFMSITKWESTLPLNIAVQPGAEKGILLPYRSTGVVMWKSSPQSLPEMVKTLTNRGHNSAEIWDLLFGMSVGLSVDLNRTICGFDTDDMSVSLLNLTLLMVDGSRVISQDILDLRGIRANSPNMGFTNFSAMAAHRWQGKRLIAMSSQGGTIVVPEHMKSGTSSARIHVLPIGYVGQKGISPCLCTCMSASMRKESAWTLCKVCAIYASPRAAFVAYGDTRYHASAMGIMIQNKHSGIGSWQLRRIGSKN